MKRIKSYRIWEQEDHEIQHGMKRVAEKQAKKDAEDMVIARTWASKYGYEIDEALGVDVVIRGLVERHNTFFRGKKTLNEIAKRATTIPPGDVADIQLGGADVLTRDGELGLLFCTNNYADARGYGHVAAVRRPIDFNGNRSKWLEKNDFECFQFDEENGEESMKKFEGINEEDHLIFRSPADYGGIVHYIFRGEIGEQLLDYIGIAEGPEWEAKVTKK